MLTSHSHGTQEVVSAPLPLSARNHLQFSPCSSPLPPLLTLARLLPSLQTTPTWAHCSSPLPPSTYLCFCHPSECPCNSPYWPAQPAHLHQPPGLTDDRVLQAIQDKAVDLLQDPDRGLSNLLHQGVGPIHCCRGCLWVRDQLHQRDIIRGIHLMRHRRGDSQQRSLDIILQTWFIYIIWSNRQIPFWEGCLDSTNLRNRVVHNGERKRRNSSTRLHGFV